MKDSAMSSSMRGRNIRVTSRNHGNSSMDTVPKFPPLKHVTARAGGRKQTRLDQSYGGISGAAMSIPPPRDSPDRGDSGRDSQAPQQVLVVRELERKNSLKNPSPRRAIPSSKSDSSASNHGNKVSDEAAEKMKGELRESMAREKEMKEKIISLQKIIDELKAKLRQRDKTIEELQDQLKQQERHYEDLLKIERAEHQKTREELDKVKSSLSEKDKTITKLKAEHEIDITDLDRMWEEKLRILTEEKNREIATRDEKLGRLKKQMADALKGNSWERQQQLDELTKELTRVQEESDMLRLKLKSFSKSVKTGGCPNCDSSSSQLQQSQRLMKEKDSAIKELKTLCAKFEKQLTQQDSLIKTHHEQKGQRTSTLPK